MNRVDALKGWGEVTNGREEFKTKGTTYREQKERVETKGKK